MKTLRFLIVPLAALLLFSCGVTAGLGSRVKKLSVGMSKQETVRIMGGSYDIVHSVMTPQGDVVEIYRYTEALVGDDYEVEFFNDVLVRFTMLEKAPSQPEQGPHGHRH
ncbi:MAG: hypothetical protein LIO85_07935 [Rikenellaceae bacterium]|nr:hypothetical protein [Rikenellaceae bacterium]